MSNDDADYETVLERYKAYVKNTHMKQYQVAEAIQRDQSTVSRWVNNKMTGSTRKTTKLVRAWLDKVDGIVQESLDIDAVEERESLRTSASDDHDPIVEYSSEDCRALSVQDQTSTCSATALMIEQLKRIVANYKSGPLSARHSEQIPAEVHDYSIAPHSSASDSPAPYGTSPFESLVLRQVWEDADTLVINSKLRDGLCIPIIERPVAALPHNPPVRCEFDDLTRALGRLSIADVNTIAQSHARTRSNRRSGIVYVLCLNNDPLMHKVGHTTRNTKERVKELRTANPQLELAASFHVQDAHGVEEAAHAILAPYRAVAGAGQEWFVCTLLVAQTAVVKAIAEVDRDV